MKKGLFRKAEPGELPTACVNTNERVNTTVNTKLKRAGDRHRPGYMAAFMREYRAKAKAAKAK